MPKFFVRQEQINKEQIEIIGQDVKHIKNVLRKTIEDTLEICNMESQENYLCKIEKIENEKIICNVVETINKNAGLPKSDKMELIIQKGVELGVTEITPVEMKRCVVKLNEKDRQKKVERWHKISEVAAKQCGRDIVPKINNVINIKNICNLCDKYDIVLVAYENEKKNKLKYELERLKEKNKEKLNIAIVIGPEGGLEENDVNLLKEQGAKIITLGNRILRTETVALNMISIIM